MGGGAFRLAASHGSDAVFVETTSIYMKAAEQRRWRMRGEQRIRETEEKADYRA